jgi:hypothetical protein
MTVEEHVRCGTLLGFPLCCVRQWVDEMPPRGEGDQAIRRGTVHGRPRTRAERVNLRLVGVRGQHPQQLYVPCDRHVGAPGWRPYGWRALVDTTSGTCDNPSMHTTYNPEVDSLVIVQGSPENRTYALVPPACDQRAAEHGAPVTGADWNEVQLELSDIRVQLYRSYGVDGPMTSEVWVVKDGKLERADVDEAGVIEP